MAASSTVNLFNKYASSRQYIAIAVSGGGDSMALLDLYRLAKSQNVNLPKPFAVTVDHGLRRGFVREASIVEAYCAKHNVPWKLVVWDGEKPQTGIMTAARLARYRLLADAAESIGAWTILTGHTIDDQNETIAMRALRGSALPMEPEVLFERRAWISRPMLEVSRLNLRKYLAAGNINFADDPTNMDLRFERAKVRQAELQPDQMAVMRQFQWRRELSQKAAQFIANSVMIEAGNVKIKRPANFEPGHGFALRYLAATLGGFDYPAPAIIGDRLTKLLAEGPMSAAYTAQRCLFMRVETGIAVKPDPRHALRQWLNRRVEPFETFCAVSMLPLANALAKILEARPFLCCDEASF